MRTYPFVGTWRHLSRLAWLEFVNGDDHSNVHDENQRQGESVEPVDHSVAVPHIICGEMVRKRSEGFHNRWQQGPRDAEQPRDADSGVERPVPREPTA